MACMLLPRIGSVSGDKERVNCENEKALETITVGAYGSGIVFYNVFFAVGARSGELYRDGKHGGALQQ